VLVGTRKHVAEAEGAIPPGVHAPILPREPARPGELQLIAIAALVVDDVNGHVSACRKGLKTVVTPLLGVHKLPDLAGIPAAVVAHAQGWARGEGNVRTEEIVGHNITATGSHGGYVGHASRVALGDAVSIWYCVNGLGEARSDEGQGRDEVLEGDHIC